MVNRTSNRPQQNKANLRAKPGGTRPQGRGTAGKCAKQTQFPAASGTRPSPLGPPASPLGQRQLYKQSQLPPGPKEGQVLGGKGVMVNRTFDEPQQNKANSSIADCGLPERHRATGIRLRRSCRIADWGQTFRLRPAQAIVRNKANLARLGQSQGAEGRKMQNEPNSRLRRAGRGRWGGDRGAIVLNKANSRHLMPAASSVSGGVTFCLNSRPRGGYNPLWQP
jgi:hypothetical protein